MIKKRYYREANVNYFEGFAYNIEVANWSPVGLGNPHAVIVDGDPHILVTLAQPAINVVDGVRIVDPSAMPLRAGVELVTQQVYEDYQARALAHYNLVRN